MDWQFQTGMWRKAYIQLIDVRLLALRPGEASADYRLPCNAFVLTAEGRANFILDGDVHPAQQISLLLHGVKGQRLRLAQVQAPVSYYMILYRARHVLSYRGSAAGSKPLATIGDEPYAFLPPRPAMLLEKADRMLREWAKNEPAAQIYAKGLLYQFVAELLEQWDDGRRQERTDRIARQMIRYLHERYAESVGLEELSARFHYSSRYLSKLFKRETGIGIIEYLIRYRMQTAMKLLEHSGLSIREVAASVGYADLFYFTRLFTKHAGVSPNRYRHRRRSAIGEAGVHDAKSRTGMSIESELTPIYSSQWSDNHSHKLPGERTKMIYRDRPAKAVSLLLILTLVLAACGGAKGTAVPSSSPSSSPQASPSAVVSANEAQSSQAAEQAFPRTYVDGTGKEVTIERKPERVAVGHFAEMEYFFALGVPPIASPLAEEILKDFEVTLGDNAKEAEVADLGDVMALNMEKLVELNPDLIIGSVGLHEEVYDQLNKIAPVIMLDLTGAWNENLMEYASIIGQEEKAEEYIEELTVQIREANEKLKPLREETVGFFRLPGKDQFGAIGKSYYSYFFDENNGLGLRAPEGYPDKWEVLSLEALSQMNPDHLVILDGASTYDENIAALAQSDIWKGLKAVKAGNVHFLDVAAATNGPYAVKYAVKQLQDSLIKG